MEAGHFMLSFAILWLVYIPEELLPCEKVKYVNGENK